jgi:hypothetical protein
MAQWLLVGLSPRKPGFDPGVVLVRFVMDILALFSPATIILQMLRNDFCSHAALA